jgi:hypothetical protein
VPEGKPLFELACLDRLNRNGITLESAQQDFVDGREFGESGFRTGRHGVYRYEQRRVFGQNEFVVIRVWLAD